LTEAFAWLAKPIAGLDPARQLNAVGIVARAVDSTGMIGGQVADLEAEGARPTREALEFIHRNKTGKLITASVLLGGTLSGANDEQLAALERYGVALGLAFQIVDDLLDQEESSATLGKTAGKDVAQGKLTYPALMGVEAARAELASLLATALSNADMIPGPLNYLGDMARFICDRRS
ncbi:MAG: polyprenyl synthetase family protein, partial [Thermoanaerobaculia bacterium]